MASNWLENRRHADAAARTESEKLVLRELRIFCDVMTLGEQYLRLVLSKGLIADEPTQAKLIVANHAFNLLCSAMDDVLVGRYDAATDHWRSIIESFRFLLALQLNPGLSDKMVRGQLKIDVALKTIRDEFTEEKYPGVDLSWATKMSGEHRRLQPFAHVNLRTASAGLPIQEVAGGRIYTVVPGGVVAPDVVPDSVMFLADAAIDVVGAVFFAFSQNDRDVQALGNDGGCASLQKSKSELLEVARERGVAI